MSVTRILIRHRGTVYRFLEFDARPDGSLLIFLDRDRSPSIDARTLSLTDGEFIRDSDDDNKLSSHAKISCHTTGEIHYYSGGKRKTTFHIDRLYKLRNTRKIAFFSIPRPGRLDSYEPDQHAAETVETLEIPQEIDERMTFAIDLAPAATEHSITFGVVLKYEVYSVAVRVLRIAPVAIPSHLDEHFVHGVTEAGQANFAHSRQSHS
jgi:hypothetical protein